MRSFGGAVPSGPGRKTTTFISSRPTQFDRIRAEPPPGCHHMLAHMHQYINSHRTRSSLASTKEARAGRMRRTTGRSCFAPS